MPDFSNKETPASLGYRMPAEWEPHDAIWLAWPHKEASWPGNLAAIPPVYAEIVKAISPTELVNINVVDSAMAEAAEAILRKHGAWSDRVRLHEIPTNDAWARDHGPMFVVRDNADGTRDLALNDWGYNAWGGKYPPFDLDDVVPTKIARKFGYKLFEPGIIMEGGSIDVNGKGTLMTTEACLLNPNRNPHLSRGDIEEYLHAYLGVSHFLWLGDGIIGDDTDGHVDDLSRFVDPTTVVTVVEEKADDENYAILQENLERLHGMTDQDGKALKIVTLPMPDPVMYEGERLPASYANFYIGNGVVLLPTYRCDQDSEATKILAGLFPDRKIIGIDCVDLIWGLGSIHCISQQQPASKV